MNVSDHFIFDKKHGFALVLCEEDASSVLKFLDADNQLRQQLADDGQDVGSRSCYVSHGSGVLLAREADTFSLD